jgi:exodeoxyribonuclease VII large subunit
MRKRCPAVEAVLVDVRVQGEGAAAEIATAINRLSARAEELDIDAIILTRGGGSIEDLWAFNERIVAEAIVRCAVPVVAAIGHETDTTIAELVADERAATPTQAAMRLTPDRAALGEQLDQLFARAGSAVTRRVERGGERLRAAARRAGHAAHRAVAARQVRIERLGARLALVRPEAVYAARRARVVELDHRLRRAIDQRRILIDIAGLSTDLDRAWRIAHERRAARIDALERELAVTGPRAVLARGYSVTTGPDGRAIRSKTEVSTGDTVTTLLADGGFTSVIGGQTAAAVPAQSNDAAVPPRAPKPAPLPTRARRRKGLDPGQPGLFGD